MLPQRSSQDRLGGLEGLYRLLVCDRPVRSHIADAGRPELSQSSIRRNILSRRDRRLRKRLVQKRRGGWRRLQLLALIGAATSPAHVAFAQNPTGGNVVAGAATINSTGSTLNVNATTDRAIVNWNSFSVGQGNTANFNLPNASSAILNRVTTPATPSVIAGQLNSNGNVYLVNPSGVVVGNTGAINTNGFTASTFDVSNRAFMNGGAMQFRGSSSAAIVNNGTINTGSGGAHFIGNQFQNNGAITSNGGSITVGSGQSVTYSNGVTHVEADMATLQNGYSETAGLINNSGTMRATGAVMSGGDVYLTSPGGRVLNSGVVRATSSVAVSARQFNQAGTVDVSGPTGGRVVVNSDDTLVQGAINASGTEQGGSVEITSGNVDQFATIDVSASNGRGGEVSISTTNAYTATSSGDINADGQSGGDVTITGRGRIVTSGEISAVGTSGDGGKIDVSSGFKTSLLGATLDASGAVDGGQVRVGGEFQGGKDLLTDELANSSETLIGPGSNLIARGETGDGGTAIVWSDDRTQFYGSVDVSGSGLDGSGGFVELSSSGLLNYQSVDGIQTGGGKVLLDPKNGVIVDLPPSGLSVIQFALADESQPLDPGDGAGFSVALNADGTLLASGVPFDDGGGVSKTNSGAVYLFSVNPNSLLTPSQLSQIIRDGTTLANGSRLSLDAGDQFGRAVALNSAGSVLAVGAPKDDPIGFDPVTGDLALADTGAVYLFDLNDSNTAAPADLQNVIRNRSPLVGGSVLNLLDSEDPSTANVILGGDDFGEAVALNGEGNRLAVGTSSTRFPRVYLFEIDTGVFAIDDGFGGVTETVGLGQILQQGTNTGGLVLMPESRDDFGTDLALNATGDLLAVGASGESSNNGAFTSDGAVYLFDLNANDYSVPAQFRQRISNGSPLATGGTLQTANATFGSALSFANDGQILAVGASSISFGVGGVFAFGLNPNDASQAPGLIFSDRIESFVTADGQVFELSFTGLGESLALSESANLIALGTPRLDGRSDNVTDSGGGLLFAIDANGQPGLAQIVADARPLDALPNIDDFGSAVALNGAATRLAVGADGENEVYIFDLNPADLAQQPSLAGVIQAGLQVDTPVGPEMLDFEFDDEFGSALAFNSLGNRLAVGAVGDDATSVSNTDKGAIYLFEIDPNDSSGRLSLPQVLREQTTLADGTNLTLPNSSEFGTAVAFDASGDRLVAGQSLTSRTFLFEFGSMGLGGPVSLAQTLEDGASLAGGGSLSVRNSERFGSSVAITDDGSSLAVGAAGIQDSSVFLFDLNANDWTAPASLAQELGEGSMLQGNQMLSLAGSTNFGTAVAFDSTGSRLVVGDIGTIDSLFLFETQPDLSQPLNLAAVIGEGTMLSDGAILSPGNGFAASISLNSDGNVLAVGSLFPDQAYLFEFETGDYSDPMTLQQGIGSSSILGQPGGLAAGANFGEAVALNADGSRLAITGDSRVFLFDADTSLAIDPVLTQVIGNGSLLEDGQILSEDSSIFGRSLALNAAGNLLAVGNPNGTGNVYLFGLNASDSSARASLGKIFLDGASVGVREQVDLDDFDRFGTGVAFNAAGNILAIGARGDDGLGNVSTVNEGAVYLFEINPSDLSEAATLGQIIQQGSTLAGGGVFESTAFDDFGQAVALNAVGDRLAVGSDNDDLGGVYLFSVNPNDVSAAVTLAQLIDSQSPLADGSTLMLDADGTSFLFRSDQFGDAVAFDGSGTRLFVGAPGDNGMNDVSPDSGAVYEFELNSSDLSRAPSLRQVLAVGSSDNPGNAIGIDPGDLFGSSVAVNAAADFFAVGATGADGNSGNARDDVGAAFLISPGDGSNAPLTGDLDFADFPGDTTIIDPDDIAAILNRGNDLTLQFNNDLDIRSDIITAANGVGTLTVQAGRSINVSPGTDINVGDGSLDFEFNSSSAIASQTDPGSPRLLLENVSVTATGDRSFVRFSADEFEDFLLSDLDPLIQVSGSTISAQQVEFGRANQGAADHRIIIDGGSVISGDRVFVRGSSNTIGIGIAISGMGTELVATDQLLVSGFGGIRIADGAVLRGVGDAIVGGGVIQASSDPQFDPFVAVGDSLTIDNASIVTENGNIDFTLASLDILNEGNVFIDDGPKVDRRFISLIDSEIQAGGTGDVILSQAGDDSYALDLSGSIISGENVLIAANVFAFSTDAGFSTVSLSNDSQINTAASGELRIYLPQQNSVSVDASSSLNGVTGSEVFDGTGNLLNNEGIGEFVGENDPVLPIDNEYLGTEDANFALYISTIDLTPRLFFTANNGQSVYGQVPDDPGVSITQGRLIDNDTLASLGVGTDFTLNEFTDAGTYTINVVAPNLAPRYRLVGTASGTFTILPADLLIRTEAVSKIYGDTFPFANQDVFIGGLRNGDNPASFTLTSAGAAANAAVSGSPYAINANLGAGPRFNPGNYKVTVESGGLTVNPAVLTINPLTQTKVYGDSMLDQSRFEEFGLQNGETISGVSFASAGIAATADVDTYDLRPNMVVASGNGFDPGNYVVEFGSLADGLTVLPAALTIRASDQFKTVGDSFRFTGTEFTAMGLRNNDTVDFASLSSDGAAEDAEIDVFPIRIETPVGNFDPNNYVVSLLNGDFIVTDEIVPPPTTLDTSRLVYDQFDRYRDFANTIDALSPNNSGSINTANAFPVPSSAANRSVGDDPNEDELQLREDVYLPTTLRNGLGGSSGQ